MDDVFDVKEHIIPCSHIREYPRAISTEQDDLLRMHIKQYVPRDNPRPEKGDVSIIGAHANGFPKELYEPLYEDIYRQAKQNGVRLRAIWIADAAWQGQSAILNEGKLGNDPGWLDYARDITFMINTFRMPRPLVGVGHSFGANCLIRVAITNPRLFVSLVLIDPTVASLRSFPVTSATTYAALSVRRRDRWPSRKEAAAAFRKNAFYERWDPRALKKWVEYGLRKTRTGDGGDAEVELATPKHQEVFTFARPSWPAFDKTGRFIVDPEQAPDLDPGSKLHLQSYPFHRVEPDSTMGLVPKLRPSALYIFGNHSEVSSKESQDEKLALTGVGVGGSGGAATGRVKGVVEQNSGHLVPMEAPLFCAKESVRWLKERLDDWWRTEKEYEAWTRLSEKEKSQVSEEFKDRLAQAARSTTKSTGPSRL